MKKNLYYLLYIGVLMMFLAGCQDEGMFTPEEETSETPVNVSFQVKLGGEEMSRAIGDASLVNELVVGVFQESELLKTFTYTRKEGEDKFTNVTIPLFKNQTYDLAFWAQVEDNGIYSIDENFNVTIDYSKYKDISLAGTESFEAFTTTKSGVTVADGGGEITLTRPFAQLNIAASEGEIFDNVDATRFTISKVYKTYHPFSGAVVEDAVENQEFSFSFSQDDIVAKQHIEIGEDTYYYLASAYLLAPANVGMTGGLYKDNEEYKVFSFTELPLAANTRTNIYGDMIQQEVMQGWDGVTFANLSDEGLTCQVQIEGANNVLHIDTPEELAYCMKNGYPSDYDAIHICANHNMGGHAWDNVSNVPNGIIIEGTSADGKQSNYISHVTLKGATTGLFGNTEALKVSNLQLKDINVDTSSDMAGVLAGTVKGNSSFTNVVIDNCKVVANYGKAGGIIGHISRKSEKERAETLSVSFNGCQVNNSTISASAAEGIFVGELSGYDNQETLSFDAECSAENTHVTDYISSYKAENQSVWQDAIEETYDTWLGTETYRRGVVKFADIRLVPKWDGTTTIEPLLANATYDSEVTAGSNRFVVYSPFDLAGVRKKTASPAAIYLREDIDLNGQGADGRFNVPSNFAQSAYTSTDDNIFNPFSYVTTLDGKKSDTENYSIYNLGIEQIEQERAAFVLYASGTTTHKNINFRNCQTVAVHKPVSTDAKAYGAILVSNVDATYTMENVHAYDCKVFALQKVGTLGARINGTSTLKNNSVNNCYVENYECKISERFSSGEKTIGSWTVTVYADFYPYGEVGGMYGFIQGASTMTGCKVNGTTIYASGQDDKMATTSGSLLARLGIAALGYYKVPGRHVSTLIGNIRATGTVTLTSCSVDTNTKCTKRHDKHNSTYNYIGQAYIVKFVDSEGSVTVDGKKLTLADCNKNTKL